jgi:hypothetical protein
MSGNFLPLAFIDPFDLIASLPRRMGLFQPGEPPTTIKVRWDTETGFRQADLSKWPELQAIINQIDRLGEQRGGIEFGRIRIELLKPGTCLAWERDDTPYAERFNRSIMALRVNPGAALYYGTEVLQPQLGLIVIVNQRVRHCKINIGETSSIYLIVDFRKKDAA